MKRFTGLFLVLALVCALALPLLAQEKQAKQDERLRYSGTVTLVNKETKTFTIQRGTDKLPISYNEKTSFTLRNQPGAKEDDLKEGKRVIVLADPSSKDKILATRVDFRTER